MGRRECDIRDQRGRIGGVACLAVESVMKKIPTTTSKLQCPKLNFQRPTAPQVRVADTMFILNELEIDHGGLESVANSDDLESRSSVKWVFPLS